MNLSRRGFGRMVLGAGGTLFVPGAFIFVGGCGAPFRLILPGGQEVESGQVVAYGTAREGETPASLYDRITTNEDGSHMDVWYLRGLVVWRVVTADGAVMVTIGTDALPMQYAFSEGTLVEYAVVQMEDAFEPVPGQDSSDIEARQQPGTIAVIIRDHQVLEDTDDYEAEDDDFVAYVNPGSGEHPTA